MIFGVAKLAVCVILIKCYAWIGAFSGPESVLTKLGKNDNTGDLNMDKSERAEIIKKFGRKEGDTGSPEVQIALLSARINGLTAHLKVNFKDNSTRRGLLAMVALRKKLLNYLLRENRAKYLEVTAELGIRRTK